MRWKPHVTVAAVVEREGRFLMVEEEAENRIVYNQPAGHLEQGESLLDAVVRETREETGWRIRPTAVVGIHQWTSPGARSFLRVAFACDALDHDPALAPDDSIRAVMWLTRADVAARGGALRSPMVIKCIDDFIAGKCYPLDLLACLDAA
ncbi:MAG: NUDIX hydrolase [Gammaproteobacteria bacterium]